MNLDEADVLIDHALTSLDSLVGSFSATAVEFTVVERDLLKLEQGGWKTSRMGSTQLLLAEIRKVHSEQARRLASLRTGVSELRG